MSRGMGKVKAARMRINAAILDWHRVGRLKAAVRPKASASSTPSKRRRNSSNGDHRWRRDMYRTREQGLCNHERLASTVFH